MGNRFVTQGLTNEATHGTRDMEFGRLEWAGGQVKLSSTEQADTNSPKSIGSHRRTNITLSVESDQNSLSVSVTAPKLT